MALTPSAESSIVNERLRQARQSFNVALFCIILCVGAGATGLYLLYKGKIAEGIGTSASGLIPISKCIKFAREANDRLDQLMNGSREHDDDDQDKDEN